MAKVADDSVELSKVMDDVTQKDYVLILVNLLEALHDCHLDARSYRTHCLEFNNSAQKLHGVVNDILAADPAFGLSDEARENLSDTCKTLEDGLSVMRRCCQLSGITKLFDHGATKERMEELIGFLNQDVAKATAFLRNEVSRIQSMKRVEKIQQIRKEKNPGSYPKLL